MKKVLILAAIAEGMTGLALLLVPSFAGWLLFSEELTGAGMLAGRVTGIALIALSVACWPLADWRLCAIEMPERTFENAWYRGSSRPMVATRSRYAVSPKQTPDRPDSRGRASRKA